VDAGQQQGEVRPLAGSGPQSISHGSSSRLSATWAALLSRMVRVLLLPPRDCRSGRPDPGERADYLLRRIVDRAVCSKCGGVEITVTVSMAAAAGFSHPDYSKARV
jgi:hypothetical protein